MRPPPPPPVPPPGSVCRGAAKPPPPDPRPPERIRASMAWIDSVRTASTPSLPLVCATWPAISPATVPWAPRSELMARMVLPLPRGMVRT
jgi:hypothetical protein